MLDGVPTVGPMSRRLRATLWRIRWLVVATCLACATWVVVGELRPAPAPTTPVLVAARDLPAGAVLGRADLRVEPLSGAPTGAVAVDAAVGATLTIGVPEGLPVVATMLLGPGLTQAAPPGWVVVPAPLADPVLAELLRVGDRVDLYLAAGDTGGRVEDAQLVSAGALVLARGAPGGEPGTSWLGAPSGSDQSVVVVAIRPQDAAGMAGASGFGPFRAVLSAT